MFQKYRDIGENRNHLSKVKQYFEKQVIVDEQIYREYPVDWHMHRVYRAKWIGARIPSD